MADVFVSYARNDKQFVQALHEALRVANRDSWVDWEDIPPSAEWLNEVLSGIEGADTFVFVISPDSVFSHICNSELEHAVAHSKRIVPVLLRTTAVDAIPAVVTRFNWIDFSIDSDFKSPFALLLQAIDTDLSFVKQHTRLLVRALEWDRAGRDRSLTLRGQELEAAAQWLNTSAAGAALHASQLHTEYISASRDAQARRRRGMLAAAGVAVAVSAGLALFAEAQRRIAVRERDAAISRELAAVAISQTAADPELAILLASEALQRTGHDRS